MRILITIIIVIGSIQLAYAEPNYFYATLNPSVVEFQVIDPSNNITGYDPITKIEIENIPNTFYRIETELGEEYYSTLEAMPKNKKYHKLEPKTLNVRMLPTIPSGVYKVKVFGTTMLENFDFFIFFSYDSLKHSATIQKQGIILPNAIWTYEINVPAIASLNTPLIMIKIANPQDLIVDLTTAGQLGYIGNTKFVTELTKEINEIEAEKAKGKVDDGLTPAQKAKKEYTELLKEITERYNKPEADEFVKQEAYTVLKEDLEYIINHL